jgi:Putative adhesin
VSITEDAPAAASAGRATIAEPTSLRRVAPWWVLVGACALALVLAGVALLVWWAATRETRVTTYHVVGDLSSIALDVGAADVEIDGGGSGAVEVRRTDHFAFGHPATERRTVSGGAVTIAARCPKQVLGSCHSAYRVTVPDNVGVTVTTTSGRVEISGLRASARVATTSGSIAATGFCGFSLRATSGSGLVRAAAECSPDRMELRSGSGDVQATLPPGRYQVDASSDSGHARVTGLTVADDAPFAVQALSGSGDVTVEGIP